MDQAVTLCIGEDVAAVEDANALGAYHERHRVQDPRDIDNSTQRYLGAVLNKVVDRPERPDSPPAEGLSQMRKGINSAFRMVYADDSTQASSDQPAGSSKGKDMSRVQSAAAELQGAGRLAMQLAHLRGRRGSNFSDCASDSPRSRQGSQQWSGSEGSRRSLDSLDSAAMSDAGSVASERSPRSRQSPTSRSGSPAGLSRHGSMQPVSPAHLSQHDAPRSPRRSKPKPKLEALQLPSPAESPEQLPAISTPLPVPLSSSTKQPSAASLVVPGMDISERRPPPVPSAAARAAKPPAPAPAPAECAPPASLPPSQPASPTSPTEKQPPPTPSRQRAPPESPTKPAPSPTFAKSPTGRRQSPQRLVSPAKSGKSPGSSTRRGKGPKFEYLDTDSPLLGSGEADDAPAIPQAARSPARPEPAPTPSLLSPTGNYHGDVDPTWAGDTAPVLTPFTPGKKRRQGGSMRRSQAAIGSMSRRRSRAAPGRVSVGTMRTDASEDEEDLTPLPELKEFKPTTVARSPRAQPPRSPDAASPRNQPPKSPASSGRCPAAGSPAPPYAAAHSPTLQRGPSMRKSPSFRGRDNTLAPGPPGGGLTAPAPRSTRQQRKQLQVQVGGAGGEGSKRTPRRQSVAPGAAGASKDEVQAMQQHMNFQQQKLRDERMHNLAIEEKMKNAAARSTDEVGRLTAQLAVLRQHYENRIADYHNSMEVLKYKNMADARDQEVAMTDMQQAFDDRLELKVKEKKRQLEAIHAEEKRQLMVRNGQMQTRMMQLEEQVLKLEQASLKVPERKPSRRESHVRAEMILAETMEEVAALKRHVAELEDALQKAVAERGKVIKECNKQRELAAKLKHDLAAQQEMVNALREHCDQAKVQAEMHKIQLSQATMETYEPTPPPSEPTPEPPTEYADVQCQTDEVDPPPPPPDLSPELVQALNESFAAVNSVLVDAFGRTKADGTYKQAKALCLEDPSIQSLVGSLQAVGAGVHDLGLKAGEWHNLYEEERQRVRQLRLEIIALAKATPAEASAITQAVMQDSEQEMEKRIVKKIKADLKSNRGSPNVWVRMDQWFTDFKDRWEKKRDALVVQRRAALEAVLARTGGLMSAPSPPLSPPPAAGSPPPPPGIAAGLGRRSPPPQAPALGPPPHPHRGGRSPGHTPRGSPWSDPAEAPEQPLLPGLSAAPYRPAHSEQGYRPAHSEQGYDPRQRTGEPAGSGPQSPGGSPRLRRGGDSPPAPGAAPAGLPSQGGAAQRQGPAAPCPAGMEPAQRRLSPNRQGHRAAAVMPVPLPGMESALQAQRAAPGAFPPPRAAPPPSAHRAGSAPAWHGGRAGEPPGTAAAALPAAPSPRAEQQRPPAPRDPPLAYWSGGYGAERLTQPAEPQPVCDDPDSLRVAPWLSPEDQAARAAVVRKVWSAAPHAVAPDRPSSAAERALQEVMRQAQRTTGRSSPTRPASCPAADSSAKHRQRQQRRPPSPPQPSPRLGVGSAARLNALQRLAERRLDETLSPQQPGNVAAQQPRRGSKARPPPLPLASPPAPDIVDMILPYVNTVQILGQQKAPPRLMGLPNQRRSASGWQPIDSETAALDFAPPEPAQDPFQLGAYVGLSSRPLQGAPASQGRSASAAPGRKRLSLQ